MSLLTYSRLQTITSTQKPYRGTTDRFPLASRRHIHKNFYVDELNGERVFRITYGNYSKEFAITKEMYETNTSKFYECQWRDVNDPLRYVRYETHPRELGILYPDNTFEFTASWYGQGERQLLSSGIGTLSISTRHGGMVLRTGRVGMMHPIFKNMRIDMDTMRVHDSSVYRMYGRRVNRAEGKKYLKQYEDFFKVSEVMLKTMDWKTFMQGSADVLKEVMGEVWFNQAHWLEDHVRRDFAKKAFEKVHTAPFDACVLYCVAYDINRVYWLAHNERYHDSGNTENLHANMRRRVSKELYKANPSVMNIVEYEMGKDYPASEWGLDIFVNNKEVEQL